MKRRTGAPPLLSCIPCRRPRKQDTSAPRPTTRQDVVAACCRFKVFCGNLYRPASISTTFHLNAAGVTPLPDFPTASQRVGATHAVAALARPLLAPSDEIAEYISCTAPEELARITKSLHSHRMAACDTLHLSARDPTHPGKSTACAALINSAIHDPYRSARYSSLLNTNLELLLEWQLDAYRARYQTHMRNGPTTGRSLSSRDHRQRPLHRSKACES